MKRRHLVTSLAGALLLPGADISATSDGSEKKGWSGSEPENYEFLKESLKFLERSRDVGRYAYFNTKKGTLLSLLKIDYTPSRLGQLYRDQ